MPSFRSGKTSDGHQGRAQAGAKFELLPLAIGGIGQQGQLVQPLLILRGRLRYRRTGGGPVTSFGPIRGRFFNEPSLGVMLREELRLLSISSGDWVSSASAI